MIEPTNLRQRGPMDFEAHYEHLCVLRDLVPLKAVKANLNQGVLDIDGDCIKPSEWAPILSSISINKNLTFLAVRSYYQPGLGETGSERYKQHFRKRTPAIRSKDFTIQFCKSIRDCLSVSTGLKTLELQGLPLRHRDLIVLTKGLSRTKTLQNLSLAYCPIGDDGLKIVCESVKNSATIKTVNFTGCNLTWRGAEHMTNIIKHQATKRHSQVWAESLRYRRPDLDCMTGLRRITMNCNTLIGDIGAAAFADALKDDLWLKALDLQQCGISDKGAKALLDILQTSSMLIVLDVRKNPLIDRSLTQSIIERILLNGNGVNSEYKWLALSSSRDPAKQKQRRKTIKLGHGLKGKATIRIGIRKFTDNGKKNAPVSSDFIPEPLPPGAEGYVPWRTAARANRFRSIHLASPHQNRDVQASNPLMLTLESASSSETDEPIGTPKTETQMNVVEESYEAVTVKQYKHLKVELEECRQRLEEEMRARTKADARLMELELENTRLRNINLSLSDALHVQSTTSTILEDEGVLESIEASFQKFHAFLDLLKDAGLGKLAVMAGIDQSDFGLMRQPQLSSTVGKDKQEQGAESTKEKIPPEEPQVMQFCTGDQAFLKQSEPARISSGSTTSPSVQLVNQSIDPKPKNLQYNHLNSEVKFLKSDEAFGSNEDQTSKQHSSGRTGERQECAVPRASEKVLSRSEDDQPIVSGTIDTQPKDS
ncbi:centrosomal protein of 78 kDa isoform X2 [Scyliorhinus canicula]|uniref:centrosomal protein of 78 kDa isoform X2 n=1 Tax=Scyliorhinus canicula TaxID=7830 RepID=UPI0018F41C06|nr:centrosomal protein of 78 kDa isoform X2 [Scyliorhinus canicula]